MLLESILDPCTFVDAFYRPIVFAHITIFIHKTHFCMFSLSLQPEASRTGGDTIDGKRVDPHGSWLSFVRHSSKPSDKKCEKDKKKSSRTLNVSTTKYQ